MAERETIPVSNGSEKCLREALVSAFSKMMMTYSNKMVFDFVQNKRILDSSMFS